MSPSTLQSFGISLGDNSRARFRIQYFLGSTVDTVMRQSSVAVGIFHTFSTCTRKSDPEEVC